MKVVTEIVDIQSIDIVCAYADVLQIGARNMQNFQLLKAAGKSGKPILLKRGPRGYDKRVVKCRRIHYE